MFVLPLVSFSMLCIQFKLPTDQFELCAIIPFGLLKKFFALIQDFSVCLWHIIYSLVLISYHVPHFNHSVPDSFASFL